MDWKATAVISGAGILATWFFSMPAVRPPVTGTSAPLAGTQQAPASAIDIQREAARLEVRVPRAQEHVPTSRDPFRFGVRRAPTARPSGTSGPPPSAPLVSLEPLAPPPPRVILVGIATDVVDGHDQRTAILNTDAGVELAREGETVAGQFKVGKIGADAVELLRISDGTALRLPLP